MRNHAAYRCLLQTILQQMSDVFDVYKSSAVTDFLKNERPTQCPVSKCISDKTMKGLTTSWTLEKGA